MYLHAGKDTVLRDREILGIFDLDGPAIPRDTRALLQAAERNGRVTLADEAGLPKAFILQAPRRRARRRGKTAGMRIVFSCLSAATLAGRAAKGL